VGAAGHGGRRQGPERRKAARAADADTRTTETIRCVVYRTPAPGCRRARGRNANKGGITTKPALLALPGPNRAGRPGFASACSANTGCNDYAPNHYCSSTASADEWSGRHPDHVAAHSSSPAPGSRLPVPGEGNGGSGTDPTTGPHLSKASSVDERHHYAIKFRTAAPSPMGNRSWPTIFIAVKGGSWSTRRPGAAEVGTRSARVPSAGREGASADETGARTCAPSPRSIPAIPTPAARYVFADGNNPPREAARASSDRRAGSTVLCSAQSFTAHAQHA
jgi:hypothetical protein